MGMTAKRIIEAGLNSTTNDRVVNRLEEINLNFEGYSEPGYDAPESGGKK